MGRQPSHPLYPIFLRGLQKLYFLWTEILLQSKAYHHLAQEQDIKDIPRNHGVTLLLKNYNHMCPANHSLIVDVYDEIHSITSHGLRR